MCDFCFCTFGAQDCVKATCLHNELGIADRRALNEISGLNQLQAVHSKLQYKF